ncbi:hypothetical protein [Clostridium botulinum]|nr:hypothetical protein [Clostridium botulinum]MBY6935739.1 hypothetical protein [Clostridium botulinum]
MFLAEINFLYEGGIAETIFYYSKNGFLKELVESFNIGRPVSYKILYDY